TIFRLPRSGLSSPNCRNHYVTLRMGCRDHAPFTLSSEAMGSAGTRRRKCSESFPMTLLGHASKLMSSSLPVPAAWYAIPLRLVVGFGFMQHGYAKLARGPEDFINFLHAMGVSMPFLLGWATIIVELVGGLFILLGAFVPRAELARLFRSSVIGRGGS